MYSITLAVPAGAIVPGLMGTKYTPRLVTQPIMMRRERQQKTENRQATPFNVPDVVMTTIRVLLMRSAIMPDDDDTLETRVPVADDYSRDIYVTKLVR
jgi:hypothetical protein